MSPFVDWPYWKLRAYLLTRSGEQATYAVTLAELSKLWACSSKTTKRHLAQWHAQGRLEYAAGRGRGNTSRLSFGGQVQAELSTLTAGLVAQGAAAELARLSRLGFPRAWVLTEAVQGVFGLSESATGTDRLRTVYTRDLLSLDPLTASVTTEAHLLAQVLDPLTRFDAESGQLLPHLAHHWQVSGDGLVWTFYLRKGVQFHHGRTLEARDVVYTLRRVLAGAAWFLPMLERVESAHPYRVTLHLQQPDAFLPRRLSDTQVLILPHDVPFDERHLIGTGAFRCQREGDTLRLRAFDAHFAGRPLIDELEFYRVDELRDEPTLGLADSGEAVFSHWDTENGAQFLIWNGARAAAQNALLREAVFELHDVAAWWRELRPPWPLLRAQSFYPRRSALRTPRAHSLARAERLLRAAHYSGPPLQLWVIDRPEATAEAEWLSRRAARLGLKIQVRPFELHESPTTSADLVMLGEISGSDDQLSFWVAFHQPELVFRHLLPPAVFAEVCAELQGYSQDASPAACEAVIDRVEALLLGGHWLHLTRHRAKARSTYPLVQNLESDSFGRVNYKKLWVGEGGR